MFFDGGRSGLTDRVEFPRPRNVSAASTAGNRTNNVAKREGLNRGVRFAEESIKGVRPEWHCRFDSKGLGQTAASSSAWSWRLGLVMRASIFGLRLLARGSTRPSRLPTR